MPMTGKNLRVVDPRMVGLVSGFFSEVRFARGYGWVAALLADDGREYWTCGYFAEESEANAAAMAMYSEWPRSGEIFEVEVL